MWSELGLYTGVCGLTLSLNPLSVAPSALVSPKWVAELSSCSSFRFCDDDGV